MSFPTSPINGQTAVVNNVTYQYTASNNSWKRIPTAAVYTSLQAAGNVTVDNSVIAGNVYTDNLKFANGAAFVSTTIGNTSEIVANIPSGNNVGLTLVATGVSAGNYGSSTSIPTIVVDSKGRITSLTTNAVSTTITLSGTSGSGSVAGGGTLTFAGTYGVTATASSSTITVGTPQDLQTTASPTFAGLTSSGAAQINNTLGVTGVTSITNNTDSGSVVTGALVVAGGVGIAGNVFVGGTLTVANLQARGSTNIVVQDPMTYFQANVLYPWTYDTGLYSDSIGGSANVYAHHGMVRNYSSSQWTFFSNVRSEPSNTINWSDAGLIYDAVKMGDLIVANSTASSGTTTGALTVSGGAGIAGSLYAGTINSTGSSSLTTLVASNFTSANAHITGSDTNIGANHDNTMSRINVVYATYGDFSANITRNSRNIVTNYSGNVAPATPLMGDEWFRGNTGVMYKYLYDNVSNTYNWLNISSALYNASTSATASTLALRDTGGNLTATNFLGTASSAKYADLAEIYTSDKNYEPGTVVVFGGTAEITVTKKTHDTRVAGVISTNPAYLMNSEAEGLPVAFTGRVPCKVRGPVTKGDVLVTSAYSEYAERMTDVLYRPGCILGKSLGDVAENVFATVEVVVGRF